MMRHQKGVVLTLWVGAVLISLCLCSSGADSEGVTFAFTSDMRNYAGSGSYDTSQYFRGVCESIRAVANIDFLIMVGDIDPPEGIDWTIRTYLGSDMPWYPVVGNHDACSAGTMTSLRNMNRNGTSLPNIVRSGPEGAVETIYSFDYGNAHFVVLNEYYNGTNDAAIGGIVCAQQRAWLETDLAATDKKHIFVIGHEPAYPQPDMETGYIRHSGDSLDLYPVARDAFWKVLKDYGVLAYICGHSHGYSVKQFDGVWQIDDGHGAGIASLGCGNASTFVLIEINQGEVKFRTYRDQHNGGPYRLTHGGTLCYQPQPAPGDFDGDGRHDHALYYEAIGNWKMPMSSSTGVVTAFCGALGMVPVPADYDGDEQDDLAVYDTGTGNWHIKQSVSGTQLDISWGYSLTTPCPADFNGDGKTDLAVYHPADGNWYIRDIASGQMWSQNWGWSEVVPLPRDYDGDGKADLCVYHPVTGNWYIHMSADNSGVVWNWGWSAAQPLPADYDGDNKADLAVFHADMGNWYIRLSSTYDVFVQTWGTPDSIPVPRDYDGNDVDDLAVFDPYLEQWNILPMSN